MGQLPETVCEDDLVRFVTHCADNLQLKYTTIKLYLAGIRSQYIQLGRGDVLRDTHGNKLHQLELVLRGVRKYQRHIPHRQLPITIDILRQLCTILRHGHFGPYIDLLMESALLLGWFGALRCGEFTASNTHFKPHLHLTMSDLSERFDEHVGKKCLELRLKVSKTDQFGTGACFNCMKLVNICALCLYFLYMCECVILC